jgi:hypothetical protein
MVPVCPWVRKLASMPFAARFCLSACRQRTESMTNTTPKCTRAVGTRCVDQKAEGEDESMQGLTQAWQHTGRSQERIFLRFSGSLRAAIACSCAASSFSMLRTNAVARDSPACRSAVHLCTPVRVCTCPALWLRHVAPAGSLHPQSSQSLIDQAPLTYTAQCMLPCLAAYPRLCPEYVYTWVPENRRHFEWPSRERALGVRESRMGLQRAVLIKVWLLQSSAQKCMHGM